MALDPEQADRLQAIIDELDGLYTTTDAEGAQEILDEVYLLITQIYERFPELDEEE